MKLKNWFFFSALLLIFGSCGENSTTESQSTDSTASTTIDNTRTSGTKPIQVSTTTRTNFETKYPNASNVTWTYYEPYNTIDWEMASWPAMDANDYQVRYNSDGMDYYSWYDQDGNWIGTTAVISDYSTLPAAVNNTLNNHYAGYTIVSVDKENDKNREAYELDLEKGNDKSKVLITADGTILKKKDNINGEKTKEKVEVK